MNSKIFSSPIFRFIGSFLVTFFIFYVALAVLRFFVCTSTVDFTKHLGYMAIAALSLLMSLKLWHFHFKIFLSYLVFWGLYSFVFLIKLLNHQPLLDREIVHTILLSTFLCAFVCTLLWLALVFQKKFVRYLTLFLIVLFILPPLIILGYSALYEGHMLSADVILTLFQTDAHEALIYLLDQNIYLWAVGLFLIFAFVCFVLRFFAHFHQKMSFEPCLSIINFALLFVFWLYVLVFDLPRLNSCFALGLPSTVLKTLHSYTEYGKLRALRTNRLADLEKKLSPQALKGVYVLVIGESETRDRMNAFGYERKNTPWLTQMAQNPDTLLFPNAYSCHTHTVPALQYALTGLNQYQSINLEDAYSLTEVARAAGFDTYWLSNQKQFHNDDIPITTIAASTKHQVWLNAYTGTKMLTSYYDEELAKHIPSTENAFIVIHLMGCHLAYQERYPKEFDVFNGLPDDQDDYDNAVLYNDYVLQKIYEQAQKLPHFMAFVYFSDHGEDVRDKVRHDASKFTFTMSHIPLFMIFSEEFKATRPDVFQVLSTHRQSYVTNDLVYNFMLTILGINDMPYLDKKLDIASDQYGMDKDNLFTLHGQKRLADDL